MTVTRITPPYLKKTKKPLATVTRVHDEGLNAQHNPILLIRTHLMNNDVGFAIPLSVLGKETVKIGDKIEFTMATSGKNTTINIPSLGGCFYCLKDVTVYPSEVISLEGYRNLQKPQTRFRPHPR